MNEDLYHDLKARQSVNSIIKTAAITGSGVDLQGYEGATVVINVGTRTDSNFPIVLKESTDNTTYSAVADADILGTQPTISGMSNAIYQFGYKGTKRYIRVDSTFKAGGASAGASISAIIVRGFKRHQPAN